MADARRMEKIDRKVSRRAWLWRLLVWLLIFDGLLTVGSGWFLQEWRESESRRRTELRFLEHFGQVLTERRRWEEARAIYLRCMELEGGERVAAPGLRRIQQGRAEEREQFIGYWSGEALAAYDAGRLSDARVAVRTVLRKYPANQQMADLLQRIDEAQKREKWRRAVTSVREAIAARAWQQAGAELTLLRVAEPQDPVVEELTAELAAARAAQWRDHRRAAQLLGRARQADQGKYDEQLIGWLQEARALHPDHPEIEAYFEKVSSYLRTLRVPTEVATLSQALAMARDGDRIVIAEGTHEGGVWVDRPLQLEGAGADRTVIEAEAPQSPALGFGPQAEGTHVRGVTFRQRGFDPGPARFPAVQVRQAQLHFSDCRFEQASGHGLELMDGADGVLDRCEFRGNGWDGVAVRGVGGRACLKDCLADGNFRHGIEVWDEASLEIEGGQAIGNSQAGLVVDSAAGSMRIERLVAAENREYGAVFSAAVGGQVRGIECRGNQVGGIVIQKGARALSFAENRSFDNEGADVWIEPGLVAAVVSRGIADGSGQPQQVQVLSAESLR